MSQDRFEVGDNVVWDEGYGMVELLGKKDKYGVGPFPIVQTEDVPLDKCCCGATFDESGECPYGFDGDDHVPRSQSVGHSQWVWVGLPEGSKQFSGAWFKKV